MDIEEKSRRDLIERYKRLERKESQIKGAAARAVPGKVSIVPNHAKNAVAQQVKDFLRTPASQQVVA